MILHRPGRATACLLLLAPTVSAQDFSYPDFSSVAGLVLNGSAAQVGNVLRVTPAANGQKGSFYYDQPVRVASGFTCTFTFQITGLTGGGADGMTFIIQNAASGLAALGDDGSGMGYAENPSTSIENCVAFEIDTWDSGLGDPGGNHVSIHTGGTGASYYDEAFSIGNAAVSNDMSDGSVHSAVIHYAGGVLEFYIDDLGNPLVRVPYDFATGGTYIGGGSVGGLNLINGDSAYVGFTAATGGANENHDVLSWDWQDTSGPIGSNYCGPANLNSSGLPGIISAFGSDVAAHNNVKLDAIQCAPNQVGMFVTSMVQGLVIPPNSQGFLCVTHPIGRYNAGIQNTGGAGTLSWQLDLQNTPTPFGPVAVQPGETWYFQAWFTDTNPGATSNFTDAIGITFL